jgi:ferredoxin
MEQLMDAPSPVNLEFELLREQQEAGEDNDKDESFEIGTPITVIVQVEGEPDKSIEAKVGDNLRTVLQQNDVEVYRGFKAKVGNCGGGGQCGKFKNTVTTVIN